MNPFFAIVGGVCLMIVIFFMLVWLLEYLWNITMSDIFNVKQITYWQAFRLMLIIQILWFF